MVSSATNAGADSPPDGDGSVYGLTAPTLDSARLVVTSLFPEDGGGLWNELLQQSRLTGDETDDAAIQRLIETMKHGDPLLGLAATALWIRLATYHELTTAREIIRSTP